MNFIDFAAGYGLLIEQLIEGRWARVRTVDKPKKKNGAYRYMGDIGFVQNHGTMERVEMWKEGAKAGPIDHAALRARLVLAAANEKAKQVEAGRLAQGMIERAVIDSHPYLIAKGFPLEKGFVLDGELLVPMREFSLYKQLNSLQRISQDGSKKFLPGGKAKGSVYMIGSMMAEERWLAEGLATALSLRAALRELHRDAQTIVCFSASNLAHIGRLVKELRPKAFVMADHDESKAGENAARETGLPWVMPEEVGTDANDVHTKYGVRALVKLIRSVENAEGESRLDKLEQ